MKQRVAHDQVAVRYTDGIDHVWAAWEPAARRCERLFGATSWRAGMAPAELAAVLRQAQYRAHTASEFAAGLLPPPSASDAHAYLLGTLASCRDALGVLAMRAELDELGDDVAEIGLHAVDATCDAFRGARSCTALVHAWIAADQVDPDWLQQSSDGSRSWSTVVLWVLVASGATMLVALVVQLLVAGGIA
jgi:hypothetical protein